MTTLGFPVKYVNLFGKHIEVTRRNFLGCINQDFHSPWFYRDNKFVSYKEAVGIPTHGGLDFTQMFLDPILNVDDGDVTYAGRQVDAQGRDWGNLVIVWHPKLGLQSLHRHMERVLCVVGQHVAKGDIIAEAGTTGFSTGNHEHFELRRATGPKYEDIIQNEWRGAIDPVPLYMNMKYAIDENGDQWRLDEELGVAYSIADEEELRLLKDRGLSGNPELMNLDGFLKVHGASGDRLRRFFNV